MAGRIDKPDTEADIKLKELLASKTSFIMTAGAGSGKTTSLVKALDYLSSSYGSEFIRNKQKIACITYTNAAVKEILDDVSHNTLFHVSTIHSFLWELLRPFQADIKIWVGCRIQEKISELENDFENYGPKAHQKTKDKNIAQQKKLAEELIDVRLVDKFNYETSSNYTKGIIGHSDILKMACSLINQKPLFRKIISNQYPFVFVDESQDTLLEFVNAIKIVANEFETKFCIGFFGDPMQKIYVTGAGKITPEKNWKIVEKPENFRCSTEVLNVINNIRRGIDHFQQIGGRTENINGKIEPVIGSATLFILPGDHNRNEYIKSVKSYLSSFLNDSIWLSDEKSRNLKILILEHRMAASRLKFPSLFSAFKDDNKDESLGSSFTEGTAWPLRPFLNFILPLIKAHREEKDFAVIELLREHCPRLSIENVSGHSHVMQLYFRELKQIIVELDKHLSEESTTTIGELITFLKTTSMVVWDDRYIAYLIENGFKTEDPENSDSVSTIINAMLLCPAKELWGYQTYIVDESLYSTQHSVKGAEFNRVLVVLDDEEGKKSTLYSYEKLFGIKELSKTDEGNIKSGNDSVIDRSRRLLYVSCSRAMIDLAIVLFVSDVSNALELLKAAKIFKPDSVKTLKDLAT